MKHTQQTSNLTYSTNICLTLFSSQHTVTPTSSAALCMPTSSTTSDFPTYSAVFSKPTRSTAPEIPTLFTVVSEAEIELSEESESNLDTPGP